MNDAIGHAGTYDPTVHYFHCQKTVKVIFLCRTLHLMRDVIPPPTARRQKLADF